jgi:ABC-2 type transport system permease protein
MIWKEAKVQFRGQGKRSNYFRQLIAPVVLASIFPIKWGPDWVNEFPVLIIAFITPAVIVSVMIPDSFAGERERNTLNTLLVSRLPDNAIIFGKIALPVLVGWGGALGLSTVSLIVTNIAHGGARVLFFSPVIAMGIIFLSFLSATLMSSGGILTSISASSAQEAAQRLLMFVLVPAMIIQIVPLLAREQIGELFDVMDGNQLLVLFCGFLIIADLVVFLLAVNKFKRSQLFQV